MEFESGIKICNRNRNRTIKSQVISQNVNFSVSIQCDRMTGFMDFMKSRTSVEIHEKLLKKKNDLDLFEELLNKEWGTNQ